MSHFRKLLTLLLIAYLPAAAAKEDIQVPPPVVQAPAGKTSEGGETQKIEKKIQIGDRLLIKIYPEDAFVKGGDMLVSSEGDITLPLLGKVKVEGMTVPQAERELVALLDKDYLVNPVVVIEITRREVIAGQEETLSILGQIQKPGVYNFPPDGKLTLLQLLSLAGGFTDVANVKKIKIIRKEGGKSRVIRADAESIIAGKDPDIELKQGDVIHVGESFF